MTEQPEQPQELASYTGAYVMYLAGGNLVITGRVKFKNFKAVFPLSEVEPFLLSRPYSAPEEEPTDNQKTSKALREATALYRQGLKDGEQRARDEVLEEVLVKLRECAQVDDNDQYYVWLEDAECSIESLRGSKEPDKILGIAYGLDCIHQTPEPGKDGEWG